MNEQEQLAYNLFQQVWKQRCDELHKLSEYMKSQGKYEWEYCICDNWEKVLSELDNNKLIPYEAWCIPKLALQTYLKEGE